jgi:hypothetical protein
VLFELRRDDRRAHAAQVAQLAENLFDRGGHFGQRIGPLREFHERGMYQRSIIFALDYQLTITPKPGYLHFRVTGINSAQTVLAYVAEMVQHCLKHKSRAMLVEDDTEGPPLDSLAIYDVASQASASVRQFIDRVAFLSNNPEMPLRNLQLAEAVAQNFKLNARAFTKLEDADAWLRQAE